MGGVERQYCTTWRGTVLARRADIFRGRHLCVQSMTNVGFFGLLVILNSCVALAVQGVGRVLLFGRTVPQKPYSAVPPGFAAFLVGIMGQSVLVYGYSLMTSTSVQFIPWIYPSRMTVDELAQSSGAQKFPEIPHFYWTCGDLFCRVKGDVDRETPGHTRRRSWE